MIEKILERLEAERVEAENETCRLISGDYALPCSFDKTDIEKTTMETMARAIEIVQEVAKEYEEKKYYRITLSCLEDSTSLEMPLTKEEYLFLTKLSELVYKVATGCMPTMYVEQKGE